MIIDTERILHASSISAGDGKVEMELDDVFPEIWDERGHRVIFAVMLGDNLVIVIGVGILFQRQKVCS